MKDEEKVEKKDTIQNETENKKEQKEEKKVPVDHYIFSIIKIVEYRMIHLALLTHNFPVIMNSF